MLAPLVTIVGAYVVLRCLELALRAPSHFACRHSRRIVVVFAFLVSLVTIAEVLTAVFAEDTLR